MKRDINVIGIDIAKRVFHIIRGQPPGRSMPCRQLRQPQR